MIGSVFGYAITGSKVDVYTFIVALTCIPISWIGSNLAVLKSNWNLPEGSKALKGYPWLGTPGRTFQVFLMGSSLVPFAYLMLAAISADALKDLLEASRYTLAIGGAMGMAMSTREIFKL